MIGSERTPMLIHIFDSTIGHGAGTMVEWVRICTEILVWIAGFPKSQLLIFFFFFLYPLLRNTYPPRGPISCSPALIVTFGYAESHTKPPEGHAHFNVLVHSSSESLIPTPQHPPNSSAFCLSCLHQGKNIHQSHLGWKISTLLYQG